MGQELDLAATDKACVWHPFTRMEQWCADGFEPLFIVRGEGAWLVDQHGRRYLDGNSTIWTNIHGHNHPLINAAIQAQLHKIAHVSALGFANEPAALLARELIDLWSRDGDWPRGGDLQSPSSPHPAHALTERTLARVFFSDDGSTAIECALKMAIQYRIQTGEADRDRYVAFSHAYHGDTMGAASLGGIDLFQQKFRPFGLPVQHAGDMADLQAMPASEAARVSAVCIEPLVQGAAGMKTWPAGMLGELRAWCDRHDVLLIADEVMTGFGRTGKMFACQHEGVTPDFVALAKGLSGGYLPLAATLTTGQVFSAFLGTPDEDRTFYYGHSYTGNPLGCAAALANLAVFREEQTLGRLQPKIVLLGELLGSLHAAHPDRITAVRQCGFIAGIDVADAPQDTRPALTTTAARICLAARAHGLLTRPIGETIVLMPPLCTDDAQLRMAVDALSAGIDETFASL